MLCMDPKKRITINNESLTNEINSLREEEDSNEENLSPLNVKIEKSNNSNNE